LHQRTGILPAENDQSAWTVTGQDLAFCSETLRYVDIDQSSPWTIGLGMDGKDLNVLTQQNSLNSNIRSKARGSVDTKSTDERKIQLLKKVSKGSIAYSLNGMSKI
jgi:hypothetical protein